MKSFALTLGVVSLVAAGSVFAATAEETYKTSCRRQHLRRGTCCTKSCTFLQPPQRTRCRPRPG